MVSSVCPNSTYRFEIADAIEEVSAQDAHMASLLVAIASMESSCNPRAVNHKDPLHSTGVWQTPRFRTPQDVLGQARVAHKMVSDSLARCGTLNLYTSGDCRFGAMAAIHRVSLANRLRYELGMSSE